MVKRFYLKGEIDVDLFQELLEIQNKIEDDIDFEIWLDSEGGDCSIAEAFRAVFESFNIDNFQLVGVRYLASSALNIFIATNCNKFVVPGTIGLAHTPTVNHSYTHRGETKMKNSELEVFTKTKFPTVEEAEEKLKKHLSKKDIERFDNHEDVYIPTEILSKF